MSNTPRTDAARKVYENWIGYAKQYGHLPEAMEQAPNEADPFYVADELERELSAERAAREQAEREREEARKENDALRGLLASSAKDCAHCGLPAMEQVKCPHGFPGCARTDDQMLFKHFGAEYELSEARAEVERLREDAERYRAIRERIVLANLPDGGHMRGGTESIRWNTADVFIKPSFAIIDEAIDAARRKK